MLDRDEYHTDKGYNSDHRSIIVYDEDVDGMVKIKLKDAVAHCGRFRQDGTLDEDAHSCVVDKPCSVTRDIFVYDTDRGKTKLCQYFGQIDPVYLPHSVVVDTAVSMSGFKGMKQVNDDLVSSVTKELGSIAKVAAKISGHATQHTVDYQAQHNMNRQDLVNAGLAPAPYEHALMFATNRLEFVSKFREWLQENEKTLPSFATAYNKLKKFSATTPRTKIKDFEKVLKEMNLLKSGEQLEINEKPVSETLEFPSMEKQVSPTMSAPAEPSKTISSREKLRRIQTIISEYNDLTNGRQSSQQALDQQPSGSGSRWAPKRSKNISSHLAHVMNRDDTNIGTLYATSGGYGSAHTSGLQMPEHWVKYIDSRNLSSEEIESIVRFVFLPLNRDAFDFMIDNNIPVPFNFMIARPFTRHRMYSMVLMKGGYDTGATIIGHTNMTLSDDGATKMHYGNYTFNHKAIVMKPKNIVVGADVMFGGYLGGNGSRFFTSEDVRQLKESRSSRLLQNARRPSMMAMILPITETDFHNHPMDVSGWYANDHNHDLSEQHYSTSQFYYHYYGFSTSVRSQNASHYVRKFLKPQTRNTIIAQDQWHYWSHGGFNGFRRSRNHLGPNLYAGVRAVFDGHLTQVKDQGYKEVI